MVYGLRRFEGVSGPELPNCSLRMRQGLEGSGLAGSRVQGLGFRVQGLRV